jgi:Na+/H+-dicarboxylate symporter
MIIAVSRLREMADGSGSKLAGWTVGYYVITTMISIIMSCIMTAFVWGPRFTIVSEESLDISESQQATADEKAASGEENPPHIVVKTLFRSFITQNIFYSMTNDELLAILIMACVVGYLIKSQESMIFKLVVELESMIMRIISFLIKIAPIGVFFLVLSNLMKLSIADIGSNLGMLIGGTLGTMAIHVLVILPLIFFAITRQNPYAYWLKISPAWITAWGSASSAATLPVTLRCAHAQKIPITVYKFACPLGCLINMDGTAIYFPMAVVFLASTQGKTLMAVDYVIIVLLATLASIGTTPIPSASLVLIIMIANSVDVEVTGMYAVIVAIDWLLDRFRTAINVSGDLFGAKIVAKITKIVDPEGHVDEAMEPRPDNDGARYA